MSVHCRILDWDSEFFGRRIASIDQRTLQRSDLPSVFAWCHAERVDCLYFLADVNCLETCLAVENGGFALKDLRVTYVARKIVKRTSETILTEDGMSVGGFTRTDLPAIERLARAAHGDTRFFFDPSFPREAVKRLYQGWIRQSCFTLNGTVLVLRSECEAAGYLSCEIDEERNGRIGLLAVAPAYRGRGFGSMLLEAGLEWFSAKEAQSVTVVTQGRNIAAQRLYQKAGFLINKTEAWHHKWFTGANPHGSHENSV